MSKKRRIVKPRRRFSFSDNSNSSTTRTSNESSMNTTVGNVTLMNEKEYLALATTEIKVQCEQLVKDLISKHQEKLRNLPKDVLSTQINLNSYADLIKALSVDVTLYANDESLEEESPLYFDTTASTVKKSVRSRSAQRLNVITEVPGRRSSSMGSQSTISSTSTLPTVFKTPIFRSIPMKMMSGSKYTVRKPFRKEENSAVNIKRIMKVGEEAISTAGSPLHVQGGMVAEPEVSIPLKDGVILNIASKKMNKICGVPHLDQDTKEKIKILCANLQHCIRD